MPHWQHTGMRAGPGVPPLPTTPNTTAPLSHPDEDTREKGSRRPAELGECSRGLQWGSRVCGWWLGSSGHHRGLTSYLVPQIQRQSKTTSSTRWALSRARCPLSAPPRPPRRCTPPLPWLGSTSSLSGSSPRIRCPAGRAWGLWVLGCFLCPG